MGSDGLRRARLVVGARLVSAECALGVPGLARLPEEPEALEQGDVRRTTASAAWMRPHSRGATATTVAYGRNNKIHADNNAFLAESTHTFGRNAVYGRYEAVEVEGDVLRFGVASVAVDTMPRTKWASIRRRSCKP